MEGDFGAYTEDFLASSIGRCCTLLTESSADSPLVLTMKLLGVMAVVTKAPNDFAFLTISKGLSSTLSNTLSRGTETRGFVKVEKLTGEFIKVDGAA